MARTPSVLLIAPARCWIASRSIMIDKGLANWSAGCASGMARFVSPSSGPPACSSIPGRGKLHRRADPSQCGEGLPAAIPRRFGRLTHTVRKRPVFELFARCSRAAVPPCRHAYSVAGPKKKPISKGQWAQSGAQQAFSRGPLLRQNAPFPGRFAILVLRVKSNVDSLTESIGFEPAVAV
jgi:hypothetical protein